MLCDWCNNREAVDRPFRVLDGFAAICETCRRHSIPAKDYRPSVGDFCCVTSYKQQQETAGIGTSDARPQKEISYGRF